jgi:MOSC domain-containing protein YiiM
MGEVVGLFLYEKKGAQAQNVESVEPADIGGLTDDHHGASRPARQILVVDKEILDDHGIGPGALREQITVDFPELNSLPIGTRITAGDAVLEIVEECHGCLKIAAYNGAKDAEAFRDSLDGRRGMFVKFVEGSQMPIRLGDPVKVL